MTSAVRVAEVGDVTVLDRLREHALTEAARSRGGPQLLAELTRSSRSSSTGSLAVDIVDAHLEVLVATLRTVSADSIESGSDDDPSEAILGYAVIERPSQGDSTAQNLPQPAHSARLRELWIDPAARRIGLGTDLLEAAIDVAAAWGCSGIDSVALPGDRATKNFFENHAMVARAIIVHRDLGGPRSR